MSWTFITVTFIQDIYTFKKYPTQRQLLKTGRLLKTQEYSKYQEVCIRIGRKAHDFFLKLPLPLLFYLLSTKEIQ